MQIAANSVVSFHYQLFEKSSDEPASTVQLESSEEGEPIVYLHGHHGLMPALQEKFAGCSAGDSFEAEVPPERGYGLYDSSKKRRVPCKHVIGNKSTRYRPGQVVTVNTPEGEVSGTVQKVGKFNLDLDLNHPLAGKTLLFKVSVVDVRAGTDEEIAHGHVHGPGGHQH